MSTAVARAAEAPQRRSAPDRRRVADRRPPLEVVHQRRKRIRQRRIAPILAGVLVAASLFFVVIGHAELTQGQVRLSAAQQALTAAETAHHNDVLALAKLENPARIMNVAEQTLHMMPPSQQQQVAHVPLSTALPTPTVSTSPSTSTSTATGQ